MSLEESERNQVLRALRLLSKNPDLARKIGLDAKPELAEPDLDTLNFDAFRLSFARKPPIDKIEEEKLSNEQIERICAKVSKDIFEKLKSELSLMSKVKEERVSATKLFTALNDALLSFSGIQEVKRIYLFPESDGFRLIAIHNSTDRTGMLRRIVNIENVLEEKFDDLYLDFNTLHQSEVDETMVSQGKLVLIRT